MFWFVVYCVIFYVVYRLIFFLGAKLKLGTADLKTKSVLITGCDTGFGRLSAVRLDSKGIRVFAGCLTQKGIDDFKNDPNVSNRLVPLLLDVTDTKSIERAFEFVSDQCKDGLWGVVNNAGILKFGAFELTSFEDWSLTLNVNVLGVAKMTKIFLPLLKKKGKGRLVNVASVAGRTATPGLAAYCASKFAVEGFSDSIRRELAAWGVKVVIIEPGAMKTPLYETTFNPAYAKKYFDSLTKEQQDAYGLEFVEDSIKRMKEIIEKRGGDPKLVVDAVEESLVAKWPWHRYTVGQDTPVWIFFSFLPGWVCDFFFSLMTRGGVPPKGLRK